MRHKVFKLEQGKLVYTGIREAQPGDAILDGDTPLAESTLVNTVQLREGTVSDLNRQILAGLTGEAKENFEKGLKNLGIAHPDQSDLRASFKRMNPGWTDEQLDIAVKGC